jgi:mono/diheme cytochrome c family protein
MRNVFLIAMLAGLAFVYFGLQRVGPEAKQAPAEHVHTNATPSGDGTDIAPSQSPALATANRVFDTGHPGYQVYTQKGCQRCHGPDLLGTRMGPALVDARQNFDVPALGEYLADPTAYIEKDPRLKALDRQYRMQEMPATVLSDEELRLLGGLILGRDS